MNERERDFFRAVLQAYPAVPHDYQSLSRETGDRMPAEAEELLHEALRDQREASRARVQRWLRGGDRFRKIDGEWQFRLAKEDFEWMLQILNDVRVGNWLQLGSPEELQNPIELLQKDPAAFFHMEAAGLFEMQFLEVVRGSDDFDTS